LTTREFIGVKKTKYAFSLLKLKKNEGNRYVLFKDLLARIIVLYKSFEKNDFLFDGKKLLFIVCKLTILLTS